MSFERLVRPTTLEAHTPQHQFGGGTMGWLPAIISKIESSDDPEGLGRIRAKCDFFSATADVPNSWDGWIWVGEETTNNGKMGGSHRSIQEGSLAVLLPMNGDPTQMLYLFSIHNRVDRPNPLFDRSQGISGTHSANDVFGIKDDPNGEHTDAFPHGVTHQVTRTGDTLQQTQGGARTHLQQDGTNRVENSNSSMVLSKEGDVTQRSAGQASSKLGADGKVTVKAEQFDSELKLHAGVSEVTGPSPNLAQQLKKVKFLLGGNLGQMGELLTQLNQIASRAGLGNAGEIGELAHSASKLMGQIQTGLGDVLDGGIKALDQVQAHGLEALGETVLPQVQQVLAQGLDTLSPQITALLQDGVSVTVLNDFLQQQGLPVLDTKASGILQDLRYSVTLQTEYVLSQIAPNGYETFKNVSGLGILNNLGKIQNVFTEAATPIVTTPDTIPLPTPDYLGDVLKLLPEDLQGTVSQSGLGELLTGNVSPDAAMTHLLGSVASGLVQQTSGLLKNAKPLMAAVPNLQELMNTVVQGKGNLSELLNGLSKQIPSVDGIAGLTGNPSEMVKQAIEGFTKNIEPMLKQATGAMNKLMHSVNQQVARAKMQIDQLTSQLQAKDGVHRLFADEFGVGASTPHGGFSFGAAGGLFSLTSPMIMKVLGKASGGLALHPEFGAALEGFNQAGDTLSRITAHGDTVAMQAGNQGITIQPEGVFVNDVNITLQFAQFASFRSRLAALEALNPVTP